MDQQTAIVVFAVVIAVLWLIVHRIRRWLAKRKKTQTIILFYGRTEMQADQWKITTEINRQTVEEKARKKHFTSIASVWCLPSGELRVDLNRASPPGELLWQGVVGRVPEADLPADKAWSLDDYMKVEPRVRSIVEQALATDPAVVAAHR